MQARSLSDWVTVTFRLVNDIGLSMTENVCILIELLVDLLNKNSNKTIGSLTESVFCGDLPDGVWVEEVVVGNSAKLVLAVTQVVLSAAKSSCNHYQNFKKYFIFDFCLIAD